MHFQLVSMHEKSRLVHWRLVKDLWFTFHALPMTLMMLFQPLF